MKEISFKANKAIVFPDVKLIFIKIILMLIIINNQRISVKNLNKN